MHNGCSWLTDQTAGSTKFPTKHTAEVYDWYLCFVVANQTCMTFNRALLIVENQSQLYKPAVEKVKPLVNKMYTFAWQSVNWCIALLRSLNHEFFCYCYFMTSNSLEFLQSCLTISFLITSDWIVGQCVCNQQTNRACHKTACMKC